MQKSCTQCGIVTVCVFLLLIGCSKSQIPSETESTLKVRQPIDLVGYTQTASGIEKVIEHATTLEKDRIEETNQLLAIDSDTMFVGAVLPHDDYLYSQQVFVHAFPHIKAKHIVVIGVAHNAWRYSIKDKLIFDSNDAWHGPYGNVPISPIRERLIESLGDDALVHNELQSREHSIEAIVPFLQYQRKDVEIVPILVPQMSWERLSELVDKTSAALTSVMNENGLVLGSDVAILISSDAAHYGDQNWGGEVMADYGVDQPGYDQAVKRDLTVIEDHLVGNIERNRLEGLYEQLVSNSGDQHLHWCGNYSVPFGVSLIDAVSQSSIQGDLLRYGTTLDPGRTDLEIEGLGVNSPANLHHWVGFAAIGYR